MQPQRQSPGFARPELLAERIADWLREEIALGRLRPEERLVEQALCEAQGVSRVSLREAFRILAADGLLVLRPNRGAAVAPVSDAELRDLFGLRAALEVHAVGCLAQAPDRLARLEGLVALAAGIEAAAQAGDTAAYQRRAADFHGMLVDGAGNALLSETYAKLRLRFRRYQVMIARVPDLPADAAREHGLILDAILRGRKAEAQRVMEQHLARLVERFPGEGAAG